MNNKPMVKVAPKEKAFNSSTFRQGDKGKAPLTKVASPKSAFSENVMPKNKVTSASSTQLQKATRLPGRVSMDGAAVSFE